MIKLLVFDLDGTLANLREVHYEALNKALKEISQNFIISPEEHTSIFDGLSTRKKLQLLVEKKNLPFDKIEEIFVNKQKYTMEMMETHLQRDVRLSFILHNFKNDGYLLYVASNAIKATVDVALHKLGIFSIFDKIICNEDVDQQKPHPQIYLKCMVEAAVRPDETLVIEDSKHGRASGRDSGAHVCGVDHPGELTYWRIFDAIKDAEKTPPNTKWSGKDIVVLIPMAGAGARFYEQGYKLPKPLIDVGGKPMIQRVIENLNIDAQFVFVVQEEHYEIYNLGIMLELMSHNCKIVQTSGLTEGAACTTLLAKEFINNNKHLLIANSDQLVAWDSCDFLYNMISSQVDGGILTFKANGNKWSYAKVGANGFVEQVAEKIEISDDATCGIYFYKTGSDYVKYAEQMIEKNIRTNSEFYTCPVFNEFISDGKKIKTYQVEKMNGIGTPSDLELYLETIKK